MGSETQTFILHKITGMCSSLVFLFSICLFVMVSLQPLQSEEAEQLNEPWKGDFSQMAERRVIRVLVVYNKMFYFLDQGVKRGITYDLVKKFEGFVNQKLKTKTLKVQVVMIPVSREHLLPMLVEGKGDIAVANLTITDERKKTVDFSDPFRVGIDEVLVTGPSASPDIKHIDDLSGKKIYVRESSSYYTNLLKLNQSLKERKLKPVTIIPAGQYLEDSDLLEIVDSGMLPYAIVDHHKAEFWVDIFKNLKIQENAVLNKGGNIGWAFRKNSPELAAVINEFVKKHKEGTKLGNIYNNRYLVHNTWVRNTPKQDEIIGNEKNLNVIKRYAEKYQIDYLLICALAYQESRFDNKKKSPTGAVGIMQVLPSTAKDPNINIKNVKEFENNVHAGVKYLSFLHTRYFNKPEIDELNQLFFSLAAYNAGPARVASLRKEAAKAGFNPDIWFNQVEVIAAKRIGRETVNYVSDIYKYFLAYNMIISNLENKEREKQEILDH